LSEARLPLEELIARVPAADQPYAVITALAVLSLVADDGDDDQSATSLAARAVAIAEAQGLSAEPLCGIVHMASGRALTRQGNLSQAEEQLKWALELFGIDGMAVHRAHVLLLLVAVHHGHGDLAGARTLLERAREEIDQLADPGVLVSLLEQSRRMLGSAPRRRIEGATPLTDRELTVLRLLPTRLSTTEIGHELHVSVNTVRSQVQAVYRKLEVTTRADAVARARELGLLPGSTQHGP
jgi:LuxR family maltose regulon positive regulatory protein